MASVDLPPNLVEGSAVATRLAVPPLCAVDGSSGGDSSGGVCWPPAFPGWLAVYCRLDLSVSAGLVPARLDGEWGGSSACGSTYCSFDCSTWAASPRARSYFPVSGVMNETVATLRAQAAALLAQASAAAFDGSESVAAAAATAAAAAAAGTAEMRPAALAEVAATALAEPYWRAALGVEGRAANGTALFMRSDSAYVSRRRDVAQLFIATAGAGITRAYPGALPVDVGADPRAAPWYTRAAAAPGALILTPPYLYTSPATSTAAATAAVASTSEWRLTVARALVLPVALAAASGHNTAAKAAVVNATSPPLKEAVANVTFGVGGAHLRLEGFIRLFDNATSLLTIGKLGCGDAAPAGFDKAAAPTCFLLDPYGGILLDDTIRSLAAQRTATVPATGANGLGLRTLVDAAPRLAQRLITAGVMRRVTVADIEVQHRPWLIDDSVLAAAASARRLTARGGGLPLDGIELLPEEGGGKGAGALNVWYCGHLFLQIIARPTLIGL